MTIYVIAGHSKKDSGAVAHGSKESDFTVELKRLLIEALKQQSPNVKVVEDNDSDNLNQVITKVRATAKPTDKLIDIHLNAGGESAKGTETFVAVGASQKAKDTANKINKITSTILNTPNRGVKTEDQTRHTRLGILHTGIEDSVLWEVEFITNKVAVEYLKKWKHWLAWEVASILLEE